MRLSDDYGSGLNLQDGRHKQFEPAPTPGPARPPNINFSYVCQVVASLVHLHSSVLHDII